MNNSIAAFAIFVLMAAFAADQTFSQTKIADSKYKKSINEARKTVSDLMSKEGIPGFSIAVAANVKIVWSEGLGFADLETSVPATPQTRFRVGSISKLFTASAAMKLYEQGLLNLDAPVQTYVPTFPRKEYEITARELLGHLSGIRHYSNAEYINQTRYNNVADSLKIFAADNLLFQPNTKYQYSSYGYVLLSNVIEGAAKQNFAEYLQNQIFNPLKMTGTLVDDNKKIIKDRARFYSRSADGQISNEIYTDTSDRLAAGGFLSTAEDLATFGAASLEDAFFKPQTRALVFTSQKTLDGKETGVGFAWRIGKDAKGRTIYHHGGASAGGRAFLIVYPDSKIVVALLCNLTFAKFAETDAANIADLFIK
jgi:serine beta-lactamase-like protein LACTB